MREHHVALDARTGAGETVVHIAAMNGHSLAMEFLLGEPCHLGEWLGSILLRLPVVS